MQAVVFGNVGVGVVGRGEHQADFPLLQYVGYFVPQTRFEAGISQRLESERRFVEMGGLFGIADVEFDIIRPVQGEEIIGLGLGWSGLYKRCHISLSD